MSRELGIYDETFAPFCHTSNLIILQNIFIFMHIMSKGIKTSADKGSSSAAIPMEMHRVMSVRGLLCDSQIGSLSLRHWYLTG